MAEPGSETIHQEDHPVILTVWKIEVDADRVGYAEVELAGEDDICTKVYLPLDGELPKLGHDYELTLRHVGQSPIVFDFEGNE